MKIAVYGKSITPDNKEHIQKLFDTLQRSGGSVCVNQTFLAGLADLKIQGIQEISTFNSHEDMMPVDLILSVGGDGTFLDTVSLVRDSAVPILGINTGRLGFLSNTSTAEIDWAITCLFEDDFRLEQRSLLEIDEAENLFGEDKFALNEISVLKKDSSSMITVKVHVDGKHLNTYWTDGLIISTATGSTAYSLSCGGPILMPGSGNFVITPIAPHNLNVRPIVINDNSILSLEIEGRSESNLIALDSRSREISNKKTIEIRKAKHQINLVQLPNHNFIQSLKNKLNWGLDKRNI